MTNGLDVDPDPYHALSQSERDHLLGAAMCEARLDVVPSASDVAATAGRLRDDPPNPSWTVQILNQLEDAGLTERADKPEDARMRGVAVTDGGRRALARGAARLDAAATVGGGE